jgi:N-acetylmuramoyl-L-alanine amidase
MEKRRILDSLYTARWCLNETPPKVDGAKVAITELINALAGEELDPGHQGEVIVEPTDPLDPETPNDSDPLKAVLVVVVGHEKKAPGATFQRGGSEYQYNTDIAQRMKLYASTKYPNLRVEIVFRDGVGISGAYRKAKEFKPDACMELHFNAFNGTAHGSEVLCSVDAEDRKYAAIINRRICQVFERSGSSRGVKVLSRSGRGGQSVYSLPGSANCLPEPFFGDNPNEAKMADERRGLLAEAYLDGTVEWMKGHGLG